MPVDAIPLRAVIFDCDGVLADTERHGHLVAFNRMFAEYCLPVQWSDDDYAKKVLIGGGKERLASLLTPTFVEQVGLPRDPAGQAAAVAAWHGRKTSLYTEIVESGALPPRAGVRRIVSEALAAGWLVAVASTSAPASVDAVLRHVVGAELASHIPVFAGDVVAHKKPAPDIYRHAVKQLGVSPQRTIVVEDSRNGLLAARDAGLACVVTVSGYTAAEDFTGAAFVVTSLGDPDGEATELLHSESGVRPDRYVTLVDLEEATLAEVTV